MAQVTIRINGYAYTVGCEDGQEEHLQAMAEAVERRMETVKKLGSQSGETRMLVLAALLMADELHDLAAAGAEANARAEAAAASALSQAPGVAPAELRLLADRAEDIAERLERD